MATHEETVVYVGENDEYKIFSYSHGWAIEKKKEITRGKNKGDTKYADTKWYTSLKQLISALPEKMFREQTSKTIELYNVKEKIKEVEENVKNIIDELQQETDCLSSSDS